MNILSRAIRAIPVAFIALSMSGCSAIGDFLAGDDNSIPPTPLEDINERVVMNERWDKNAGVGLDSQYINLAPAITSSTVYVADREGQITSLNRETGNENWQIELEMPLTAGIGIGSGYLFVGNESGELLVLNESDGSIKWKKRLSSIILAVPAVSGGIVVARTQDGKLYGLSTDNGEQLWVYDRGVPVLSLRGLSSPIIGGGQIVFTGFDSGKLTAVLLQTGQLIWEKSIGISTGRTELERLIDIDSDPLLIGRALYAVSYNGKLIAMDAVKGDEIWSRDMSSHVGMGADVRYVYVTDDESNVWAIDQTNGQSLWKQDKLKYRTLTAPVATGRYVVVGDFEGYLHVLSSDDGEIVGRTRLDKSGIRITPVYTSDNILYVYGNSGTVSAITLN